MASGYISRLADAQLEGYLNTFGAVVIEGPKWCGKTTTGMQRAASQLRIADPAGGYQNRRLATLEPIEALTGDRPRLIDEWQEVPSLWDAVRFECDQSRGDPGQFILTGSSTPRDQSKPLHSGAGRIGRMRMDTLTLQELGISDASTSLQSLFAGDDPHGIGRLSVREIAEIVCRGGWPAAARFDTAQAMRIARSYIDAVVEEDIEDVSGISHDPNKVRKLITSLARNESTLASHKTIVLDANTQGEGGPRSDAILAYLKALKRMFVVDDIPAWSPALRSPVRIRSTAKHHLADPSLAAAAIGATPSALLKELKTLGYLFESLVGHELIAYARMTDATVWHYRDDSDLEVDFIVQTPDGRWGAFEVKLGADQVDAGAKNVNRLDAKMSKRGERPAAVKAVIVGMGGIAERRDDGVCIIPIDSLGA